MNNIPCFLIPAIVGLISGILGYLIGRLCCKNTVETDGSWKIDLENCNNKNRSLQAELDKLKVDMTSKASNFVNETVVEAKESVLIPFSSAAAAAVYGKTIKQDDLKVVEGIGPKIEELFNAAGIKTWKELGETSVERLQEILNEGGERFKMHNPGTWSRQSMLAYQGKWEELKEWQDTLDGGK